MGQSLIQRSFAGGEIAPSMYGRADQVKYQTGLKRCRNFMVLKHGGASNRAGTRFVAEVKDSAVRTYFIKFVFNDDQTYVIEVGNGHFRFIRNGAQIVVSGVAAYNGATTYAMGNLVSFGGLNYYSKIDGNLGNQPDISPTQWYVLAGNIFEIPTPYTPADLATLKFVQSGDVVTITHTGYEPRELTRTGHTAWTLRAKSVAPSISAPTGLAATAGAAGGIVYRYKVTAVKTESYEESLPSASAATAGAALPTEAAPNTLTWNATSGAVEYNVYRETSNGSGYYAFIGVAGTNAFADRGFATNVSISPPITRNPFSGAGNFPKTASYYQQRQLFGGSTNAPEKVYGSRTAMFNNFTISSPLQPDDAVTFTIAGRKVNEVRHIVEVGQLVILTSGAEWLVLGDADGTLQADQPPNLKNVGYNGASEVPPLVISNSLLFTQARGSVVRDLKNDVNSDGTTSYNGRDLTVFAGHLFLRHTVERWDYAQIPNSIVWAVREDGTMLGLTYLREHEVWGWHRHDTDGAFEDICVVPEGNEDAVYVIVRRVINGVSKRYIERMTSRNFSAIAVDAVFMDSYLTYDGRNTGATTLTLSTGAGWTVDDAITITAAAGTPFVAGDVGNWFVLNIVDNNIASPTFGKITATVTIAVTVFTDTTHVTGTPSKTVPVSLRGVATTSWSRAVDEVAGLDHLKLKNVAVFADGHVIATPLNDKYVVLTVSALGALVLDRPYSVIHVGLGYLADIQTLDLDVQGEQVRDKRKNVAHVALLLEDTRGLFVGPDEDDLDEMEPEVITDYGVPSPMFTGVREVAIAGTWNESGSFIARQKDPIPATILSAIPNGLIGG